jgi:hypothetical protein
LEKEIDLAVDRLFVEKKRGSAEGSLMESSNSELSYEMEKKFDREKVSPPPSISPPFLKSIEKMESQLLSLEWEITKENLQKTREEVLHLRGIFNEEPNISFALNLMGEVLSYMIKKDENIRPPFIKFLLDAKETIKLLLKKETDSEINIYKQLAYSGIEARFSCLEGIKLEGERDHEGTSTAGGKQIEEILSKMNTFSEKMDELLKKLDQHLLDHERPIQKIPEPVRETKPLLVQVTIFRVDGRLFGVESDKISKIFKIPSNLYDKFSTQQKIRLKDFELRMIDLKKIFSIQGEDKKGEKQILALKENEEFKGLMIDQILNKLSSHLDIKEGYSQYFSGMIHWTYEGQPVEIPVLDLKKF